MKSIQNKLNLLVLGIVLLLAFPGCSDDNTSDLKLDGDTWLTALELNDTYTGVIDRTNKTVTVAVPEVYDTDAMKVTGIEVSEGAEASVKAGDVLNFSFPQVIKVTNGNVFLDYTVNIKHDEARILSFKLNDAYAGVIDQTKRTITPKLHYKITPQSIYFCDKKKKDQVLRLSIYDDSNQSQHLFRK